MRLCWCALAVIVAGCATPEPRPARVLTMGAHAAAPDYAFPVEGAIWRLDDKEFKALGPLPVELVSDAADAAGSDPRPPAAIADYRYGYVAPPPPILYYGLWFGLSYRFHNYGPRYRHTPFSRFSHGGRHSRRH